MADMTYIALFLAVLAAVVVSGGFYLAHLTLAGQPPRGDRVEGLRAPRTSGIPQ